MDSNPGVHDLKNKRYLWADYSQAILFGLMFELVSPRTVPLRLFSSIIYSLVEFAVKAQTLNDHKMASVIQADSIKALFVIPRLK